jgi:hypothetical protein
VWFRGFAHSISRIKAWNNKASKRKTSRIWYYNYWDEAIVFLGLLKGCEQYLRKKYGWVWILEII